MITQIGIISGKLLELLDRCNGSVVFSEIKSILKESHDLVLMSIGWLLHKGYVRIIEDPNTGVYFNNERKKTCESEAYVFDLLVRNTGNNDLSTKRIKDMAEHLDVVAGKLLSLLEKQKQLVSLHVLEVQIDEHRDIILMSLGWLIRDGFVRGIIGTHGTLMFDLSEKRMGVEVSCH